MAEASVTFTVGAEQATVVLPVELPFPVYEINAQTAPWSPPPFGSTGIDVGATVDQTASINAQIAAIPDGLPGMPNVIRFPVPKSQGKYFIDGDLANFPRGSNGGIRFNNRHHLIIEGPSAADPATFYNVKPAVPASAKIDLNEHSLRRLLWFTNCSNITVRNLRVEGSDYTMGLNLAFTPAGGGVPWFWRVSTGNDPGAGTNTRGYHAPWETEHAFAFDGCDDVLFEDCQVQDVWGDGLYLGNDPGGGGGTNRFVGRRLSLMGTGRQGIAMSRCADVLLTDLTIGTSAIRPRRAMIDLEPVTTWVVERVEISNFDSWMGPMTMFAALGHSRVDDINIHDGIIRSGNGSRCNVAASDGTQRKNWELKNVVFPPNFGSPLAPIRFTKVANVKVENCDVSVASTQSRVAAFFSNCDGVTVKDSRWGSALWVDRVGPAIPQLINNTPALTLRP